MYLRTFRFLLFCDFFQMLNAEGYTGVGKFKARWEIRSVGRFKALEIQSIEDFKVLEN